MIKRTLCFGNPAYLSLQNGQLVIERKEEDEAGNKCAEPDSNERYRSRTNKNSVPVEDIGVLILEHPQITITHGLMAALLENKCAIVTCNSARMPVGLVMPLDGSQVQSERFREQIAATEPMKKQLWQQTMAAKIRNQAAVLGRFRRPNDNMKRWIKQLKSGDPENLEGRAAAYYWKTLFPEALHFVRDREGDAPNNLLNYGYAVLRAVVARALVGSGLLVTSGIHHRNKYNAFCLADDIMEPFRPYVDLLVAELIYDGEVFDELTQDIKKRLLSIPVQTIRINETDSPLMVGVQQTTASLAKCFSGTARKIVYPEIPYGI